jgi:hypothetical protein
MSATRPRLNGKNGSKLSKLSSGSQPKKKARATRGRGIEERKGLLYPSEQLQAKLRAVFDDWRSKKRYSREPVPGELLEEARRMIGIHGVGPVARATGLESSRLTGGHGSGGKSRAPQSRSTPSFSRVELAAPAATYRPFAEVETPTGVKVRIFTQSDEVFGLLWSLCVVGGKR